MIEPLFNPKEDQWVTMVGRYMLNMGAVEAATRILIQKMSGVPTPKIYNDPLERRIAYLRKKFPRSDSLRHGSAMNILKIAEKHAYFRNIIAHSPIVFSGQSDGSLKISGIMNLTPHDKSLQAELVSLEELANRVSESASVARDLLAMQSDFNAIVG